MAEELVVKCALAQLRGKDGTYSHHYQGAPVPELYPGDAERLKSEGLIGPDDSDFVPGEWTGEVGSRKYVEPKWVKKGSAAAKKAAESEPATGTNR